MKNNKILCFGEILWDRLPDGSKAGGAPFNVALHLNKIGLDVTFVGKIGKDSAGKELQTFAEKAGLSTAFIQVDEKLPTSEVLVHLDKDKNASYEICEPVAWDNILLTDELSDLVKDINIIVYGSLASRNVATKNTLLSILKSKELIKVMDVNLRTPYNVASIVEPLLVISDIIKLNDDELHEIAGWHGKKFDSDNEAILWFASHYKCDTVCVTKGSTGAVLYSNEGFYEHPGYKVNAVDTVGAGDAFLAGLLSARLSGKKTEETLNFASATGAYVVTKAGATPDYDLARIEEIKQSNNMNN